MKRPLRKHPLLSLLVVSALVGLAPAGIQMLFICVLVLGATIYCLQEGTHV